MRCWGALLRGRSLLAPPRLPQLELRAAAGGATGPPRVCHGHAARSQPSRPCCRDGSCQTRWLRSPGEAPQPLGGPPRGSGSPPTQTPQALRAVYGCRQPHAASHHGRGPGTLGGGGKARRRPPPTHAFWLPPATAAADTAAVAAAATPTTITSDRTAVAGRPRRRNKCLTCGQRFFRLGAVPFRTGRSAADAATAARPLMLGACRKVGKVGEVRVMGAAARGEEAIKYPDPCWDYAYMARWASAGSGGGNGDDPLELPQPSPLDGHQATRRQP